MTKFRSLILPRVQAVRKYQTLTANFYIGSLKGQINSVWKTRESRPEKVSDFKASRQE